MELGAWLCRFSSLKFGVGVVQFWELKLSLMIYNTFGVWSLVLYILEFGVGVAQFWEPELSLVICTTLKELGAYMCLLLEV